MVRRRRDTRHFGAGPYLLGLRRCGATDHTGHPFDVPAIAAVEEIRLDAAVTLLAGDNATGKSTVVEAVAAAMGFSEQGGELQRLGELPAVPRDVLDGTLEPVLSRRRPRDGYFLRAESFFNVAAFVDSGSRSRPTCRATATSRCTSSLTASRSSRWRPTASAGTASMCSTSPRRRSRSAARSRCSRSSCGPPSPARSSCATHSPILLAIPGARIYELSADGVTVTAYDDLEAVRFTRGFLDAPERYVRAALGA